MSKRQPAAELKSIWPSLKRILSFLNPHLKPHRPIVAGGFVALFAEVIFRLLEPWPMKFVIDGVIGVDADSRPGIWRLLLLCALSVVGIAGMRALAGYLRTVCFALAGTRTMTSVRANAYSHVLRLSMRFHHSSRGGDLINRLISDIGKVRDVAVTAAMPLLGNIVTLVAMLIVMVVLDWRLALVVLLAFPLFALSSSSSSKKITSASRVQRKREGDLAGAAGETLGAIKVVQAYSLTERLENAFAASNGKELKEGVKATRLSAALERKTDLLVGFATAIVLLVGGWSVIYGNLTPGTLVVFVQYLKNAFKPMRDLAKYTGRIAKATASGERILDLMNTDPEVTQRPNAYAIKRLVGEIRFENVTVSYTGADKALDNLSLRIRQGTKMAIVGQSGSGKTTLAALLLRLQDPVSGSVRVDGHDLRDVTIDSLRAHIAFVLQESVLFKGSITENIAMGRDGASQVEIEQAARAANAHEFIMDMPDGYETQVGERGATLSGGQRQRIAIARAMLRDASVIVLDEALTGLDPKNSAAVLQAIDRLAAGRTTLVITHSLIDAMNCDEVIILEGGRVVERGVPTELLHRDDSRFSQLRRPAHESDAQFRRPQPKEQHDFRRVS